jgi:4-hydroxy-2-oxoheptanedioate aldolase
MAPVMRDDDNQGFGPEITRRRYMQGTAATAGLAGMGAASARPSGEAIGGSEAFIDRVEAGETVYGMATVFASMDSATVVGNHPAVDWVWIDGEHGAFDFEVIRRMVSVVPEDTAALVRIPGHHPREVDRALDAGADGVIIPFLPRVDGPGVVEDCRMFVEAAYYPPEGNRGASGLQAGAQFGLEADEYFETINDRVFVMLQVETREMIDNIDEIAQIDGLDCLLVGPFDLSFQLSDPQNFESAEFQEAVDAVLEASQRHGVAPGYWVGDEDEGAFVDEGWQVLSLGGDANLLASGIDARFPEENDGSEEED